MSVSRELNLSNGWMHSAHLRQLGNSPQFTPPELGRNLGKFQTTVWDIVWRTETRAGGRRSGVRRQAGTAPPPASAGEVTG
jgi:hypothetical protein